MRKVLLVPVVVFVIGMLSGCGFTASASGDDLNTWQGTWKLLDTQSEGNLVEPAGRIEWVVKGDTYFVRENGKATEGPFKISVHTHEKQIDVFNPQIPTGTAGAVWRGIYRVSGDTLIVCYDKVGVLYPTSFTAPRGTLQVVMKLRRS